MEMLIMIIMVVSIINLIIFLMGICALYRFNKYFVKMAKSNIAANNKLRKILEVLNKNEI